MRRHVFTPDDLYVGAELVCTYVCDYFEEYHTIGEIYHITEINLNAGYPYRITDNEGAFSWDLGNLNAITDPEVAFYPLDQLSDKEKFMVKMSGRLPE